MFTCKADYLLCLQGSAGSLTCGCFPKYTTFILMSWSILFLSIYYVESLFSKFTTQVSNVDYLLPVPWLQCIERRHWYSLWVWKDGGWRWHFTSVLDYWPLKVNSHETYILVLFSAPLVGKWGRTYLHRAQESQPHLVCYSPTMPAAGLHLLKSLNQITSRGAVSRTDHLKLIASF